MLPYYDAVHGNSSYVVAFMPFPWNWKSTIRGEFLLRPSWAACQRCIDQKFPGSSIVSLSMQVTSGDGICVFHSPEGMKFFKVNTDLYEKVVIETESGCIWEYSMEGTHIA